MESLRFNPGVHDSKRFAQGAKPEKRQQAGILLPYVMDGRTIREIAPLQEPVTEERCIEGAGLEVGFHIDHSK
jgi:hypothetical protein